MATHGRKLLVGADSFRGLVCYYNGGKKEWCHACRHGAVEVG